jgi:mRNA-degrading endonuclease HigB of HigAB toxin-antitoxin module
MKVAMDAMPWPENNMVEWNNSINKASFSASPTDLLCEITLIAYN